MLLHDHFLSDGPLETKVPLPGPGNAWTGSSGTNIPVQVVGGRAVIVQTDGGLNGREATNVFGLQSATATTFALFDFRLPAADNVAVATDLDVADEGVPFISLGGPAASALRAHTGILPPTAGGDFRLALNADSSNLTLGAVWPTELEFDTTYRAIVSYSASNAVGKLWLNPVSETSPSITHTGTLTATLIDRIVLRQADDYAGKQLIDNVVVATTFADALRGGEDVGVPGDYDGNRVVDAADYVVWRENRTLTGANPADGNGDMVVDDLDYEIWRERFGNTSGLPSSSPTDIPEPTTASLLVAVIALFAAVRHRIITDEYRRRPS
jgi:hypothetical protein